MTSSHPRPADLVLKDGLLIDGTGKPPVRGDLAVSGDRIVAIGAAGTLEGEEIVDLGGLAVAPGFIDVHTHDDRALLVEGGMQPKLTQGVTTVVTGNCGISLAPLVADTVVPPLDLVAEQGTLRYADFADYLDDLERRGPSVNVIALVGHTTLRVGAMGGDLGRPATSDECSLMRARLESALRAGAWGMSSGTFYPPASAATTDELVSVGEPLRRFGGFYATHMRNEADKVIEALDESFDIGRRLGVRVVISHHKLAGVANHGRSVETLKHISAAMSVQPVSVDCYPYNASSTMLHPDMIARAKEVMVTWSRPHPEFNGQSLHRIAEDLGCDQQTAARRLMPAGAIYFVMDENDVRRILSYPKTMVGTDGLPHDAHPHPRLWGAFPRVLGHYCREEGLFSLEEAVRKMTGLTAEELGIPERGLLKPGYFADLVVFNPATVASDATFSDPARAATGIRQVYVNGVASLGTADATTAGRVLRRSSTTPPV